MAKTLCDWSKKDIEKHFDELCALTRESRFICRKCARSAATSKVLCKPRRIPAPGENTAPKTEPTQGK